MYAYHVAGMKILEDISEDREGRAFVPAMGPGAPRLVRWTVAVDG
jgi:hypothetical protein